MPQDEGQEVTIKDMRNGASKNDSGYDKLHFCAAQAESHDLQVLWGGYLLIDKSNVVEVWR